MARAMRERPSATVLGLHLLMGPEAPTRLGNVMAALEAGAIAPTQVVAERGA